MYNGYATVEAMNEGMRILELLTRAGKTPAALAKSSGVTRQAIAAQLSKAKLGKNAWLRIREGLHKLKIDPALIRPEESFQDPEEDLRPLIFNWSSDQLRGLKHIIEAHPLARGKLLFYIDGKLTPNK